MNPYAVAYPGWAITTPLLQGDAGTEQTISSIRRLVDEALRDPYVRQTAGWIASGVQSYDDLGEVRAIYEWVRRNIGGRGGDEATTH